MGWAACLERACFNSPEWGGGSSPVKTEPPQIVLLLLLLLLLFWTRLDVCVCTLHITRTCKLAANSYPCRPGDVGLRIPRLPDTSPGKNRTVTTFLLIVPPSFYNQHPNGTQDAQNNATSSTHVDENAPNDQRGVQVFFCLVEIAFFETQNHWLTTSTPPTAA